MIDLGRAEERPRTVVLTRPVRLPSEQPPPSTMNIPHLEPMLPQPQELIRLLGGKSSARRSAGAPGGLYLHLRLVLLGKHSASFFNFLDPGGPG
jgi:hypothetical protein